MPIDKNGLTAHELTEIFRQIPLLQAFNDGHLSDILSASRILIVRRGPDAASAFIAPPGSLQ